MELGLEGKAVLVTGSSRGIGRAVAEAFLAEGARVAITGRTADTLDATRRELAGRFGAAQVLAFQADLTAPEEEVRRVLDRITEALGGIDVLVANIGDGSGVGGLDADEEEWERMLRANLLGMVFTVRHCVPIMVSRGGGSVVLISSIAGLDALPAPLPYSVAKAGVLALGQNLGRQLPRQGIRVNVVSPGNVLHPGGTWQRKLDDAGERTLGYIEREVPMNRFGTPAEIAAAVLFLSSERAAGFITGANLTVDGGQTCRI